MTDCSRDADFSGVISHSRFRDNFWLADNPRTGGVCGNKGAFELSLRRGGCLVQTPIATAIRWQLASLSGSRPVCRLPITKPWNLGSITSELAANHPERRISRPHNFVRLLPRDNVNNAVALKPRRTDLVVAVHRLNYTEPSLVHSVGVKGSR